MKQTIGGLIDSLGVTAELEGNDIVSDVIVLGKIISDDGQVAVLIASSESCSWLESLALVTAAAKIIDSDGYRNIDD